MTMADETPGAPPGGRLFQEDLRGEPFWMLVACSLVNLTTWRQAKPALTQMRELFPSPEALAAAKPEDLHDLLRPLGLWRRRATSLRRLANAWLREPPDSAKSVLALPGCGQYASDSWAIFIEGRSDVHPTDKKLSWYLANTSRETTNEPVVQSPVGGSEPDAGEGGTVQQ